MSSSASDSSAPPPATLNDTRESEAKGAPAKKSSPEHTGRQIRRLLTMLGKHRVRFWIATLALLGGSAIGLLYPQAARFAVNEGLAQRSLEHLDLVALALVAGFVVQGGFVWVRHYLMSWLGERVVADLRQKVFERLLTLPPSWFHERRTGELVGRLASDVTVIEGIVGSELSIALRNVLQLVGGLVLLFISDVKLTAVMLLVVPPLSVGAVVFGRKIRKMSRAVQDKLAVASAHVEESVSAIETVQAFTREETESGRYREGVEGAFTQALSLAKWRASFMSSVTLAGLIAVSGIVWLGGREVVAGNLTGGELAAFMLYTMMVSVSLGSLAGLWGSLQRAAGATERLFDIIDTVPEIRDPDEPLDLPEGGGRVRYRAVDFRYPSRPEQWVLRDISLEVAPGETVAFVGTSGAGKSTLTSLLLRFFDVDRGAIEFEGIDVSQLELQKLRQAVAIVSQEPILLSGTIRDNIAYGALIGDGSITPSQDAIESAARDAHAHDFISSFPDGYDTLVGQRGVKLSGGQRQRIAIARAIVANPRVLILDEATSNLDAESEHLVQEALGRLMKNRTTLVIAHRLSTVRDADRIVVLQEGRIVEQGTHEALMQNSTEGSTAQGVYRRLVEHQLIDDGEKKNRNKTRGDEE